MTETPVFDLDAAKRETRFPKGIPFKFGGEIFYAPAELPADVFDPLLDEDLDLAGIIRDLIGERDDSDDEKIGALLLNRLLSKPELPGRLVSAFKSCYRILLGGEQYEKFVSHRPSFNTYIDLARALMKQYGVGLGEVFGSRDSSESDGATSKRTSPSTTGSTPEASGPAQEAPGS